MTKKKIESFYIEMSPDNDQKETYEGNSFNLQNHSLVFIVKKYSLLPANSVISHSPMAHSTSASLDMLTSTNFVKFGNCQDSFGHFFWPKNDSEYLDIKFEVF